MRSIVFLIFTSLLISACGNSKSTHHEVQAPSKIENSFEITQVSPLPQDQPSPQLAPRKSVTKWFTVTATDTDLSTSKDNAKIRIKKSSLEKEFLWHAELIVQLSVPKFNGLKSRVVAFRLRGDSLFMVEATQGHSITTDLPQTLILAKFPITFQDDAVVEFDFNRGMSDIFTADEWRASDFDGAAYQGAKEFTSVTVKHSYINSAEMNSVNELIVVQHAVVTQVVDVVGNMNTPIEARHYISPYTPTPGYAPIASVNFDRMGFFEVAPQLAAGSVTNVFASRFNPTADKTITFAVSSNTPAEYKDAVREGVLYWNRAFGFEKIKIVDAPAGITAPNSEYNIVQWVDWDAAGSAYADAQADPRTGEIRHAQVFMTSAFAFSSKYKARSLLRQLESNKKSAPASFSLAGLSHSTLCDRDNSSHLEELLSHLATSDISDDRIIEISRDYIREVVAHEIGHTLGLRHNFAGNLSANFDVLELENIFNKYLKDATMPEGIVFSSSVMEYQNFTSSVMSGRQLVMPNEKPLSYDVAAINVLYKDVQLSAANTPIFCTDTHKDKFIGCSVWDQGASPLADAVYNERLNIKNTPQALVELIIRSKTLPFGLPVKSADELVLNPEAAAKTLLAQRSLVIHHLTDAASDLRVHRSFKKVDALNKKAIAEKTIAEASTEITRLGGLKKLLALPSQSLAANWTDDFNTLIESAQYREGVGYNGLPYKLTDEEVATAKLIAEQYFLKIQESLSLVDIASLTTWTGSLTNSTLSDELAEIISGRMIEYIFSESGNILRDRVVLGDNKSAILSLPVYKYENPIRLAAAGMLTSKTTEASDWGLLNHILNKNLFSEKVKSLLMENDINKIRAEKNPREIARWLIDNKILLATLGKRD